MNNKKNVWEILRKLQKSHGTSRFVAGRIPKLNTDEIVDILLHNRGIKTKEQREEFFEPGHPDKLTIKEAGISKGEVNKVIKRLSLARENKEKVIVYGDYDADGICATAILWETLYALGLDALPYVPDRFTEGYGLNPESVEKLKIQNPNIKLIITVDNGIVASKAVNEAKKLGIDVIITDHHTKGSHLPRARAIIHTTEIGGAGIAWILSREISRELKNRGTKEPRNRRVRKRVRSDKSYGLDLVAIGTVADLIPLLGANRTFVKYGLDELNKTKRIGLLELFKEAALEKGGLGTYEVGYIIAPRLNAMGRLEHAVDSLRLLCTKSSRKARKLAAYLGKTNKERQKVVDEVVLHSQELARRKEWQGVMVLAHESYHEGVIGLAASKLVEEYYRPAIVISKGEVLSKASARSISGFNIIRAIKKLDSMLLNIGGHPMAAGFSIKTKRIEKFSIELEKTTSSLLTDEILNKKIKIDLEVEFSALTKSLLSKLIKFEPTGPGNPKPVFISRNVNVLDSRAVGYDGRHLKMRLETGGKVIDAIGFGLGDFFSKTLSGKPIDIAFNLESNVWNSKESLQLRIKDIRISS